MRSRLISVALNDASRPELYLTPQHYRGILRAGQQQELSMSRLCLWFVCLPLHRLPRWLFGARFAPLGLLWLWACRRAAA
jgi:hypothetical protein